VLILIEDWQAGPGETKGLQFIGWRLKAPPGTDRSKEKI
jgi:hypothetical protein